MKTPDEITRQAVAKVRRIANDPVARRFGSARFSTEEVVALSMLLERLLPIAEDQRK